MRQVGGPARRFVGKRGSPARAAGGGGGAGGEGVALGARPIRGGACGSNVSVGSPPDGSSRWTRPVIGFHDSVDVDWLPNRARTARPELLVFARKYTFASR